MRLREKSSPRLSYYDRRIGPSFAFTAFTALRLYRNRLQCGVVRNFRVSVVSLSLCGPHHGVTSIVICDMSGDRGRGRVARVRVCHRLINSFFSTRRALRRSCRLDPLEGARCLDPGRSGNAPSALGALGAPARHASRSPRAHDHVPCECMSRAHRPRAWPSAADRARGAAGRTPPRHV